MEGINNIMDRQNKMVAVASTPAEELINPLMTLFKERRKAARLIVRGRLSDEQIALANELYDHIEETIRRELRL